MMEITAEIRALIDKAAAGMELAGDEYIDPANGLIHCKKCGGQRQTGVPCFGKPGYFMPRCICQCQKEAEEQRKAAEERQRRMERIKRRKAQGLQDRYLYDYTFANDNGQNPLMDKARAYGRYQNVFLTDEELADLQDSFPTVWGQYIEKLSEYMASTGKRYQSHAATIRRWAGEDAKKTITPSRNRDYSVKEDETV